MSALAVSANHVTYLLQAALQDPNQRISWGGREPITHENADAVGLRLLEANRASLGARYGDRWAEMDPPTYQYPATLRRALPPEPVGVLKALDFYEYQCCEHEGWETSDAKLFCDWLRGMWTRQLPGYGALPWGID